jgi:ABC-2 type transport system permease protein
MTVYLHAAWVGARRTFAARGELVTQLGLFVFIIVALSSLWRAATGAGGGSVGGYDVTALVWYIVFAESCVVPIPQRTIETIGDEIGSGEIAIAMLRPVSVLGLRFALDLGGALARQLCFLGVGSVIAVLVAGAPHNGLTMLLAGPAVVLALATNLAAQHALAGVAFWLRDARSTWFLFGKLVLIGGGVLIPLDLLPAALSAVCRVLPFASMAYAPGSLAAGRMQPALLVAQAGWLVLLLILAAVVFSRGLRRVEVLGG